MTQLLRWEPGRDEVDELLTARHLERVVADNSHATQTLAHAERHLESAHTLHSSDPQLAFSAAYDAARKALVSLLAVQGLRATSVGGHLAVYRSALAQFDPPLGTTIKPFDWLRRTRNDVEYPRVDSADIHAEDIAEAIERARDIIDLATRLISVLPPYRE